MIYCIIAGILRIENTRPLQLNGVFKKLLGVETFPNPATIRRFLYQLPPQSIRQIVKVHNSAPTEIVFHPCYRNQCNIRFRSNCNYSLWQTAKSQVGLQSEEKGQKVLFSYVMFRIQSSGIPAWKFTFWECQSYKISQSLFKRMHRQVTKIGKKDSHSSRFQFLRPRIHQLLRRQRDKLYYRGQPTKPLQRIAYGLKYHPYKKDWEVADFSYQSRIWKTPQRFVVQRRPLPEDPEEKSQLSLFTIKDYGYRALITNLRLKPRHVWNFHNQRAKGAELNIKELKNSYPLTKIPTQSYTANIAYLQILLFAFNLVNWFKRLCLPKEFRYKTLRTIRQDLIVIPARLVRIGRSNILRLPAKYPYQKLFYKIAKNIETMNF